MEILLPSIGSMAMAGEKGSAARTFSSSGEKTMGVGVSHGSAFGFGGGASSLNIGGCSSCAGRAGTESIVRSSARCADVCCGVGVESHETSTKAAKNARRLIVARYCLIGARDWNRTSTPVREQAPETCASTNSATRAEVGDFSGPSRNVNYVLEIPSTMLPTSDRNEYPDSPMSAPSGQVAPIVVEQSQPTPAEKASTQVWNLPNSLTLFRIFLVPFLVVVLLTKFEGRE